MSLNSLTTIVPTTSSSNSTTTNSEPTTDSNRWVCPNDRVLSLRAKLDVGWSVRCSNQRTSPATMAVSSPSSSSSPTERPFCSSPNKSSFNNAIDNSLRDNEDHTTLRHYRHSNHLCPKSNSARRNEQQQQNSQQHHQANSCLTEEEQRHVLEVIARAKQVELMEKERINRLTDRLKNMTRNSAIGLNNASSSSDSISSSYSTNLLLVSSLSKPSTSSTNVCSLCGERIPFFVLTSVLLKPNSFTCRECGRTICTKCVVDHVNSWTNETVYFCKICSETREIWKKSGAWFLKTLPTFPLISSTSLPSNRKSSVTPATEYSTNGNSIHQRLTSSRDDDSSSSNLFTRRTNCPIPPTISTPTPNYDDSVTLSPPSMTTVSNLSFVSSPGFSNFDSTSSITSSSYQVGVPPSPAPSTSTYSTTSVHRSPSWIRFQQQQQQQQAEQENKSDRSSPSSCSIGSVESLVERMKTISSATNEAGESSSIFFEKTTNNLSSISNTTLTCSGMATMQSSQNEVPSRNISESFITSQTESSSTPTTKKSSSLKSSSFLSSTFDMTKKKMSVKNILPKTSKAKNIFSSSMKDNNSKLHRPTNNTFFETRSASIRRRQELEEQKRQKEQLHQQQYHSKKQVVVENRDYSSLLPQSSTSPSSTYWKSQEDKSNIFDRDRRQFPATNEASQSSTTATTSPISQISECWQISEDDDNRSLIKFNVVLSERKSSLGVKMNEIGSRNLSPHQPSMPF